MATPFQHHLRENLVHHPNMVGLRAVKASCDVCQVFEPDDSGRCPLCQVDQTGDLVGELLAQRGAAPTRAAG